MDTFKRIAYLHQVQSLLNDLSEEKETDTPVQASSSGATKNDHEKKSSLSSSSKLPLVKLNAFFGFLSKEIAMKHNVQILNSDEMRQFRCKRCFAQYNFHTMSLSNGLLRLSKGRNLKSCLELTCSHCGFLRKVIFKHAFKTKYERVLAGLPLTDSEKPKRKSKKNKKRNKKRC